MPLDPQVAGILAMLPQDAAPLSDDTLPAVRESYELLSQLGAGVPPEIAEARDDSADGVPVKIYRPTVPTHTAILFVHGGGWTIGTAAGYDALCRVFCARTEAVIVSVDYRLAPEHPYPAAVDDCWTALQWLRAHVADLGVDAHRICVGGDSAGGNLSAVLAQRSAAEGLPLALQILMYPATDAAMDTVSHVENAKGYFLEHSTMEYFQNAYCPPGVDRSDPAVSPLRASRAELEGVAPALVITAEFDPLRDEGEAYAAALREAGVEVEATRYDGMIHGFVALPGLVTQGSDAIDQIADAVRRATGGEG